MNTPAIADLILTNGRFHTLDRANPQADAVAIAATRPASSISTATRSSPA